MSRLNVKALTRYFLWSAGVLLFVAATAKITSGFGHSQILDRPDPILSFSFRHVFMVVGIVELFVAVICFAAQNTTLKAGMLVFLASSIGIYRLGLMWIGYHKPCQCLGNLTEFLRLEEHTADTIMKSILAYLLVGGFATLVWNWGQRQKRPAHNLDHGV